MISLKYRFFKKVIFESKSDCFRSKNCMNMLKKFFLAKCRFLINLDCASAAIV